MALRAFPSEKSTFRDPLTGVTLTQLTDHKAHSHHLYFTNPGWHDGGRRLLFGSDRGGRTNLYSVELATGVITQLTDSDMPGPPRETSFLFASVNPRREEAYYWRGGDLMAIDLTTGVERVLYRAPDHMAVNMTNVTADGMHVCTCLYENMSGTVALLRGYVGFREYWASHPLSQVLRVPVDGGAAEVMVEEREWIGHVNTSPTQPHLLTYCHEGPWDQVEQRIWGLDMRTGRTWKIRPQEPGVHVGHEYWMEDGEHIGYHGGSPAGRVFGVIRHDNTDMIETPFPFDSQHFFSLDRHLVVGDGTRAHSWDRQAATACNLLWRWRDGGFDGPRVLCEHRCSAHVQQTHVHPRITPDRKAVLYTSDTSGYGQLYLAELRAFEELPTVEQAMAKV